MASTENVLEIRDLVKDFPGVRAVDNVSFDIKRNTVHCLVGENGAGKSTLMRCLNRLIEPTSGKLELNGEDITRVSGSRLRMVRKRVGMIFQQFNLFPHLKAIDNITLSGIAPRRSRLSL